MKMLIQHFGCHRDFCAACNGSGYDWVDNSDCEFCQGSGEIESCGESRD